MCDLFGGPSQQEEGLQAASSNLSNSLNANYQTEFSEQQGVLQQLNGEIGRIQSGTQGPGFSGAENASNISQIENTGAATARNTEQALQDQVAGQQFGGAQNNSGVTSGVRQQLNEEATSAAENQTAGNLFTNTLNNYAVGRQNAQATAGALTALSGQYNPAGYANASLSANNTSFGQAKTIEQQQQEKAAAIAGLIESGVSAVAGGVGNLDMAGTSSFGEQLQNFMQGA